MANPGPKKGLFQTNKAKLLDTNPYVTFIVRDKNGEQCMFKMKKISKLEKMMNAWCLKINKDRSATKFVYDGNQLHHHQTPQEVGIIELAEICVTYD